MRWTIVRHESPLYFRVTLSGRLDLDAFDRMIGELADSIESEEWPPILLDERARDISATTQERLLQAGNSLILRNCRFAYTYLAILYKPGEDLERGRDFKRMTAAASYANIEVFDDEAEALNWLLSGR